MTLGQTTNQVSVDVTLENFSSKQLFYLYQLTESLVKAPDFKLNPITTYKNSEKLNKIQILPKSITVLSTNGLFQPDVGLIK